MKLGIDISTIIYNTGVSEYTKNLVRQLLIIDSQNSYTLFGGSLRRSKEIRQFVQSVTNEKVIGKVIPLAPVFADLLWNRLHTFSIETLIGPVDLFHTSDWSEPPSKAKKVTTVHDIVPLLYPQWSHPKIVAVHKRKLDWVKRESNGIIVPSETTRNDLLKFGFPEEKVVVIPEAPHEIYGKSSEKSINETKKFFGIKKKYLLAVGVTPRKNIQRIIDAFNKLRDGSFELVVVGHQFTTFNRQKSVKFIGFVHEKYIADLFAGAETLVYPSLYEGFGLPILNAYKSSIPVVTSNLGSMKEIGEGSILVDPYSIDSIKQGIIQAIKNKEKLTAFGRRYVKKYSWSKTAHQTLKFYEKVVHI